MNVHRYDEAQRRNWVREKIAKKKSVRQILQEAAISRATLYNWIEEFGQEEEMQSIIPEKDYLNAWASQGTVANKEVPTAADMPGTRYKMLLSALGKVDADGQLSRKLVSVLVRRFTLTIGQACEIVGLDEETYGYKPRKPEVDDQEVYELMAALLHTQPELTFVELYEKVREKEPSWPRKQIKRIYRERRLYNLRSRQKPKGKTFIEEALSKTALRRERSGSCWDLVYLQPTPDRAEYILAIVDDADGQALNAATGIGEATPADAIEFFDRALEENGAPRKLRLPGKAPFTDKEIQRWAWGNKIAFQMMTLNKQENLEEIAAAEQHLESCLSNDNALTLGAKLEAWLVGD